jgi:cell division protein FtsB
VLFCRVVNDCCSRHYSQRHLKELLKHKEAIALERASVEAEIEALEKRRAKLRDKISQVGKGQEDE